MAGNSAASSEQEESWMGAEIGFGGTPEWRVELAFDPLLCEIG